MARYPRAELKLLDRYKPGGSSARISLGQRRLILHTAVTSATSLFNSMNVPGTPSSHFYVDARGNVEQYIDTRFMSSANLDGNHDCITVETQDKGPGFPDWSGLNVPGWTDDQLNALAQLAVWCHRTHGIPLQRLPSSRPGTKGVGWHRLGINGNYPPPPLNGRIADGELWSESDGKACPGDRRIHQVIDIIIPTARAIVGGTDTTGDTDVQFSDKIPGRQDDATVRDAFDAALDTKQALRNMRVNLAKRDRRLAKDLEDAANDQNMDADKLRELIRRTREQLLEATEDEPEVSE